MATGNNIFLDLTGPSGPIVGSCTDKHFTGKIELKSFTFSVAPVPRTHGQPPPPAAKEAGDEKGPDKRADDSLAVVKVIDSSSADLLLNYCRHLRPEVKAQEIKKAVLTYRLARGASTLPMLVLTFTGLYVIDYKLDDVGEETEQPTESVSFSYKTCTIQYTAIPKSLTEATPPRSVTWDRTTRQTR